MAGLDPVTAIANAISSLAKEIGRIFDGQNQKLRLEVKEYKAKAKANDIAEEIFRMTDQWAIPKKDAKKYWKKRELFDKCD